MIIASLFFNFQQTFKIILLNIVYYFLLVFLLFDGLNSFLLLAYILALQKKKDNLVLFQIYVITKFVLLFKQY